MRNMMEIYGFIMLGALLRGCTFAFNKSEPASQPVVLGALYSLTGGQSGLDIPSSQGAQLAVDEVNRSGGVLGRQVQLVLEDVETDPQLAVDHIREILAEDPSTIAFLGLSDTDLVLSAASAVAEHGRLFLTSGATSPKLPSQVPGYLFLACFGDNVQAAAGAEWAYKDMSARSVSILYNSESTYTQLLQGYFRARFEELGGKVLSIESYIPGSDISTAAGRLEAADLIYLSATPDDVLTAVKVLRDTGHPEPILGGDGFDVAGLWQDNPQVKDVFFTTHAYLGDDNKDPKVVAFLEAYRKAYPDSTPDAFAALGYDAARLLITAISDAGNTDPEDVRTALANMHNFYSVTGQLGYLKGSQIPIKSVTILGIEGGMLKLVRQVLPDKVPEP